MALSHAVGPAGDLASWPVLFFYLVLGPQNRKSKHISSSDAFLLKPTRDNKKHILKQMEVLVFFRAARTSFVSSPDHVEGCDGSEVSHIPEVLNGQRLNHANGPHVKSPKPPVGGFPDINDPLRFAMQEDPLLAVF